MPSETLDLLPEEAVRDAAHGGMEDVYSKPGHLIRRVQQIAVAAFAQECEAFDVTPVQYAALIAVRDNADLDATRIAALIACDRSTMGNVIERLESKGLIERRAHASDRRVKVLKITRRGARLIGLCEPAVLRAQDRMLDPLTRSERQQLLTLMRRIVARQESASRGGQNG